MFLKKFIGDRAFYRTLLAVWHPAEGEVSAFIPTDGTPRILYPSCSDCTLTAADGGFCVKFQRSNTAVLIEIR